MRLLLLAILLTSCSSEYVVDSYVKSYSCQEKVTYSCNLNTWFWFNRDQQLMLCETREECNTFCDQLRNKGN